MGNALSFVYTAQLAAAAGADLLLRIDDMDSDRTRDAYIQDVFDTLDFLGIQPTAGPVNLQMLETQYTQKKRMHIYTQALDDLIKTGLVYHCSCSRKTLEQHNGHCVCNGPAITDAGTEGVLRIKVLPATPVHFTDALLKEDTSDWPDKTSSFVVRRKEGIPAYQLTSVCDDVFFKVTHIVRGRDLLTSTLMQLYLAVLLQYETFLSVTFYHHPVLLDSRGEKLSKSAGAESIREMRRHITAAEMLVLIKKLLVENGMV